MTSALDLYFARTQDSVRDAIAFRGDSNVVARAMRLERIDAFGERRARTYEASVVAQTEALAQEMLTINQQMHLSTEALVQMVERAEAGGELNLAAWQTADAAATRQLRDAEVVARRASVLAEALVDPLAGLTDLETRMASLRERPPVG